MLSMNYFLLNFGEKNIKYQVYWNEYKHSDLNRKSLTEHNVNVQAEVKRWSLMEFKYGFRGLWTENMRFKDIFYLQHIYSFNITKCTLLKKYLYTWNIIHELSVNSLCGTATLVAKWVECSLRVWKVGDLNPWSGQVKDWKIGTSC